MSDARAVTALLAAAGLADVVTDSDKDRLVRLYPKVREIANLVAAADRALELSDVAEERPDT